MEATKHYYLEGNKVKLIIHLGESFSCTPKTAKSAQCARGQAWERKWVHCACTARLFYGSTVALVLPLL